MNIQTLIEKIRIFQEYIIESGFKRDVEGYKSSITPQQNRQNLQLFQDIANKIQNSLTKIYESDLPESLKLLLPTENERPFTEENHLGKITEIIENRELPVTQYFSQLNSFLSTLNTQITTNQTEIERLKIVFQDYTKSEQELINSDEYAVISIIFKDLKTTTSLKEFSKTLNKWNRTLLIYHQLLTSNTPEEIEIVEVQNGSIDVIVNLDFDIAVDLVELVKYGFKVFGGYLLYKSTAKDIIATYFGNKTLIKQEEQREKEMLENIYKTLEEKISEQHKSALENDGKIEKTALKAKIKDVAKTISEHIVKGNDIKLLAVPENDTEIIEDSKEMNYTSINNRKILKELPEEDKIKLIERYSFEEDNDEK
ncbi:hypothetical protein [Lacinutrix sp.]|uniref:hypothetical protein n=1 Tax=Lacinutrix sp. TaxID=1937692 RepID=UPI0025BE4C88|nr:hypothetical protein [Lacinutrix sp.]